MIPYFDQPQLSIGPVTIHLFGVLVAIAVMVGYRMFRGQLRSRALDPLVGDRLFSFIIVGGFVGAHLADRLVYFPGRTLEDPWSLLRFWEGLSSFGGFVGAIVGAWVFALRRQPPDLEPWPYLDSIAYAFPFGWIFGRAGCFVAFDHPGSPTSFFLAERYRDGIIRHNLGLDEALYTVLIAAIFWALGRKPRAPRFYLGLLALLYAPFRFALDFLRLVDVRYFGLTPGQWGTFGLLAVGVYLLRAPVHTPPAPPARPEPPPGEASLRPTPPLAD
jgi:phosphatidylglycerol:prolipoprotein diacylglycerol transferase